MKDGSLAETTSFREFVMSGRAGEASDFDGYSIRQAPAMDRIVRYENLTAELDEVSARLELPEAISDVMRGVRAKAGIRPSRRVSDLYSDETRRMIEVQFAREITYFGYSFPGSDDRVPSTPLQAAG